MLKRCLEKTIPDLFSFSFILLPDELLSEQLVVDSFALALSLSKDVFQRLKKDDPLSMRAVKSSLFQAAYILARKKNSEGVLNIGQSAKLFFGLNLNIRAILFLKYKTDFSSSEIQSIMAKSREEVMLIVNQGRNKMSGFFYG